MPRIRTIKPEFPQSESMGRISRDARLCFIELWTIADDSGRLRGSSRMLASLLFPYDNDAPKLIDGWLTELIKEHCIIRYQVNSQHYIEISNWCLHQKIDKPSPSKLPPLSNVREDSPNIREYSSEDQGPRTKDQDQGMDQGETSRMTSRVFQKPTLEEVREYCLERKNSVDPEKWFDFYESKGWMIGKNPMKSWQAAVRTWEKNSPPLEESNIDRINRIARERGIG